MIAHDAKTAHAHQKNAARIRKIGANLVARTHNVVIINQNNRMKLISLNIWGAQVYEPLMAFLKLHATDTDIFCFQEVFNNNPNLPTSKKLESMRLNIFSEIQALLTNFNGFFRTTQDNDLCLAAFVRNKNEVLEENHIFTPMEQCADDPSTLGRSLQYVVVGSGKMKYLIANIHGLWNPKDKQDTPERITQSMNIKKFLDQHTGPKILCGDFNLLPDTESIAIIERTGMRNLIKEYSVNSTRSPLYRGYTTMPLFADYTFVSPEIKVLDFKVLQDVVSDHLPMMLEFE